MEDTKRLSMPVSIATDTVITAVTSYRTSYLTGKRRSPTNRARKSPIDRSHSMHPALRRVCVGFFITITFPAESLVTVTRIHNSLRLLLWLHVSRY